MFLRIEVPERFHPPTWRPGHIRSKPARYVSAGDFIQVTMRWPQFSHYHVPVPLSLAAAATTSFVPQLLAAPEHGASLCCWCCLSQLHHSAAFCLLSSLLGCLSLFASVLPSVLALPSFLLLQYGVVNSVLHCLLNV